MGVTIKQIATEVGLSWPAVSQILNNRGRFAAETRQRVIAVAAKHGYRPNSSARALRQQSSRLVGVLFRNDANNALTNMSAFEYLIGINLRFQEADFGSLVIRAGELEESGNAEPRVFRERLVDGVIVVGALPDPLVDRLRSLIQQVIWLDAPIWEKTCCVRRDEHYSGYSCVNALADLGYRRVTFVARGLNRLSHHSHAAREAGAKIAASERRVQLHIINWPEDDEQLQYEMLRELLNRDAGLVVSSLVIARRIAHAGASIGRVPGYHFGMVCCDDSFDVQTSWRCLSRAAFNRYALGERAAEMMLSLLATPKTPPLSHMQREPWCPGCTAWGPSAEK